MRTCIQIGSRERELSNFWASKMVCVRVYMHTKFFKAKICLNGIQSSNQIELRTCVHAYKMVQERAVKFLGFKKCLRTYVRTCVQKSSEPRFSRMIFKVEIKLSCVRAYMRTNWLKRELSNFWASKMVCVCAYMPTKVFKAKISLNGIQSSNQIELCTCVHAYKLVQ